MTHTTLVLAAGIAATSLLPAQQRESLLFTTLAPEVTLSAAPPPSLQRVWPQDVMTVRPAIPPQSAEKYAPHVAWITLAGDEDDDGRYFETVLGGYLDAVFALRYPIVTGPDMRDVYVSPRVRIDDAVSLSGPLRPADVARILPDGQFRYFLKDEQVRLAFGIPAGSPLNVDAVTADPVGQRVYLSLEGDQTLVIHDTSGVLVTVTAGDGSILAIPVVTIFSEPVFGVVANSGIVVATEAEVDAMVDHSGVADRAGAHPTQILDLDGLDMDPLGGHFTTQSGRHPNLLFCGETLTGAGILSTGLSGTGYGRIAEINGVPMASQVVTTGQQVGLRPMSSQPRSLNGLRLAHPTHHFVTETPVPVLVGGSGTLHVDIGGAVPGPAFLLAGVAPALPPAAAVSMTPFNNPCFPEFVPFFVAVPVGIDAQGFGSWQLPGFTYAGQGALVFQAVTFGGSIRLSTPLTIELL